MPENNTVASQSSPKCSYCQKESFYIFHKNKKGKVDWVICKNCLKKFCDKVLGEGKDGGRIS